MAKTADEVGLYNDLPPDATVDGWVEDDGNPGWAEVSFSDGRVATLPVETAKAMPQTPAAGPAPVYGTPGDFGAPAPVVPPQEPMLPEELAASGAPAAPPTGGGYAGPGMLGASPFGRMSGQASAPATVPVAPQVGTSAPVVDPMAEVVSPGSPGGFADFSAGQTSSVSTQTMADDPETQQGRVDQAYEDEARSARLKDTIRYRAASDQLDTELDAYDQREAALRTQRRQAELEAAEHQRVIRAIEKTPIDEDGFWQESPGRKAAAWIALGLSGFLQGATRGQNPALNQMVQALNHAQDRWLQNQQKSRDSTFRARERLLGDAETTRRSLDLQLSGVLDKKIAAEAQRAGLPVPPGLETYRASLAVKRAEAQNAIGQRVVQTATEQVQREQRATPATGPVRRGDVVLQQLGVDKKAHADAMDPKGLNMGGVVGGAERLQTVHRALEAIAARNGGQLPSQETVSWSTLGLAPQAARLGIAGGKDEVSVKQLLEEAKLAYKQTVNIKSIDSENEGKNFNAIMDSGEGESTLEAIRTRADIANQNAVGIASGVTRDPQGYIDFVRGSLHNNQGVTRGVQPRGVRTLTGPAPRAEAGAVEETQTPGAGGAAPGPLPPAGAATSLAAKAPET